MPAWPREDWFNFWLIVVGAIGALALYGLVALERATHRLTKKSFDLQKAIYDLQKAFEDDRTRIDVFIELITDPERIGGGMNVVLFRLCNLSAASVLFDHVTIAITLEGKRWEDYKMPMNEIVADGAMRDFNIAFEIGQAVAKHSLPGVTEYRGPAEVKAVFRAFGKWRHTDWEKKDVAVSVPG